MPHLTVEYSANLNSDMAALCGALHAALTQSGLFEMGAIRVRALPCPHYVIADKLPENAFADMILRIGKGRSDDDRTAIGAALMHVAQAHFAPQLAQPHLALSLEVQEISALHSWKTNAIHPRLRHTQGAAMPAPKNHLKAALAAKQPQFGIWLNLASPYSAELLAGSGFDWLLIDGEHGPNAIPTILAQAQTIGSRCSVVVRPPIGETWMIKQILDLGAQTILVPMVESLEHAAQMVRAMRYPPEGVRGLGASVARAADFGRIGDYLASANAETCLLLQVESRAGLAALSGILALDGVDGVFIGPSDLAADMGHPGNTNAPEVQAAIDAALTEIVASGKSAGILTFDTAAAARYKAMGVTFLGVGGDIPLLMKAAAALAETVRRG